VAARDDEGDVSSTPALVGTKTTSIEQLPPGGVRAEHPLRVIARAFTLGFGRAGGAGQARSAAGRPIPMSVSVTRRQPGGRPRTFMDDRSGRWIVPVSPGRAAIALVRRLLARAREDRG
jgi:hypothetical protein